MTVVINTVSTVSEQERSEQGRRDVEVSPRPSGHYAARRLSRETRFVQKTANKVVYNDGKRLIFAYPFLDVAALMDLNTSADLLLFVLLSTVKSTTM